MRPRFTIVIPTYKRPAALRMCLGALAALDYSRDEFEVIVVDDGGTTPIDLAIAEDGRFAEQAFALRILRTGNNGPGAARNAGAAVGQGRYLAFTDDDCRPTPGWLRGFDAALARVPGAMVGGRTVNALRGNHWAETSQVVVAMAYDFYNSDPGRARFFAANNMAVPADIFAAAGGFAADVFRVASEDRDLCDRWRHAGHRLLYAQDAVVADAHDLALTSFCRQHFRYGRGAVLYHRERARRHSGRLYQDMGLHVQLPRLWHQATRALTARERGQIAWRLAV